MKEVLPDQQNESAKQASAVIQEYREQLLALPNVVGVGVGLRQKAGQWTDTVAIIVLVSQKQPLEALAVEQRVPVEIDGVPVDVQEIGSLDAAAWS